MTAGDTQSEPVSTLPGRYSEGIPWGYRFSESGESEIIQGPILHEAVNNQDRWIWLNFDLSDPMSVAAISLIPNLPPLARDMLAEGEERQHIERHGDVLFGVAGDYDLAHPDDLKRVGLWRFVMTPNLFVSALPCSGLAINRVHRKLQGGHSFSDVTSLFVAIIHEFASAARSRSHDLSLRLNEMEERFLENEEASRPRDLTSVRHLLVQLQHQVMPLRAMVLHMVTDRPDWMSEEAAEDCQSLVDRLESLVDDLNYLRERCHDLNDDFHVWEADRTNKRLSVLSILSSLMMPPTLVASIFGMNVQLPFQQGPFGFLAVCGLSLLSVVPMLVVLRRVRLI